MTETRINTPATESEPRLDHEEPAIPNISPGSRGWIQFQHEISDSPRSRLATSMDIDAPRRSQLNPDWIHKWLRC